MIRYDVNRRYGIWIKYLYRSVEVTKECISSINNKKLSTYYLSHSYSI